MVSSLFSSAQLEVKVTKQRTEPCDGHIAFPSPSGLETETRRPTRRLGHCKLPWSVATVGACDDPSAWRGFDLVDLLDGRRFVGMGVRKTLD